MTRRVVIRLITTINFFASQPFYLWFYGKMELKDGIGRTRRGRERNKRKKKKEKQNKIISQKGQKNKKLHVSNAWISLININVVVTF